MVRGYQIPVRNSKKDALDAVFHKIQILEKRNIPASNKKRSLFYYGISAAASVLIIAGLYIVLASQTLKSENNVLTCRLPDNSRVVIQNNSEIKYNRFFPGRSVKLKGTAYFEVEKGSNFKVEHRLGKVEVLGTRFLVEENADGFNVQCYEGKVKATISGKSVVLTRGLQLINKPGIIRENEMDERRNYPDFALFSKIYTNELLVQVIKDIEQFYNVEIVLNAGKNRKFTGNLNTGSLAGTLDIICTSMQLNYKFSEKTKIEIYL